MTAKIVDLYEYCSLFLYIAPEQDIEQERQALEAETGNRLRVFRCRHETRSGARVTLVEWEINPDAESS